MEETPTIFTLRIDDPHGVDVRTLFPGLSVATIGELSSGAAILNVDYAVGGKPYVLSFTGHDFDFTNYSPDVEDGRGWFTAVNYEAAPTVGPHVVIARMTVSLGGGWGAQNGVPLVSAIGFSPDSLLNATAGSSPVRFAEIGGSGPDRLWGSAYGDTLYGEGGRDRLTGNGGDDTFVFDGTHGKGNLDHVTDFAHGHDRLKFDTDSYGGLDGVDLQKAFHDITKGGLSHEDKGDRLLYNHNNGKLFYDPDGDKPGKHDHHPVHIATLDHGPHLTWHDLLVA